MSREITDEEVILYDRLCELAKLESIAHIKVAKIQAKTPFYLALMRAHYAGREELLKAVDAKIITEKELESALVPTATQMYNEYEGPLKEVKAEINRILAERDLIYSKAPWLKGMKKST